MAFHLEIEDVFSISGRGTVVTGTVAGAAIRVGDRVFILRDGKQPIESVVTGIQVFRRMLEQADIGTEVGLLVRGVRKEDVRRGDIISHTETRPDPVEPNPVEPTPLDPTPLDPDPVGPAPLTLGDMDLGKHKTDAPALLLPLRLETAFAGDQLLVRAYPDQIHVDSFDPSLSDAEIALVNDAQAKLRNGLSSIEIIARLRDAVGGTRADYLSGFLRQPNFETHVDTRGDAPFRTQAKARGLPTQLIAKAVSGGRTFFAQGSVVPSGISLSPDADWVGDFAAAQAVGLGLVMQLDASAVSDGIDALHVLGLDGRADGTDDIEALFEAHKHSSGLSTQPAATQSFGGGAPEWPGKEDALSLERALNASINVAPVPGPDPLLSSLVTLMWEASLRPALMQLYGLDDDRQLTELRAQLDAHLAPFGPYPMLRVGKQPYAIAPVCNGKNTGIGGAMDVFRPHLATAAEAARTQAQNRDDYAAMALTLLRTPISQHWRLRSLTPVQNIIGHLLTTDNETQRQTVSQHLGTGRARMRDTADLVMGNSDALPKMGDWVPVGFAPNVCGPLVREGAEHRDTPAAAGSVDDPGIFALLEDPEFWQSRASALSRTSDEGITQAPLPEGAGPEPVLRLYAENAVLQVLSRYALVEGILPEDPELQEIIGRRGRDDGLAFGTKNEWFIRHHLADAVQQSARGAPLLNLPRVLTPSTVEGGQLQRDLMRLVDAVAMAQKSNAHATQTVFAAVLDCVSNRTDVWDMMTAKVALEQQRDRGQDRLAIGAWGYVEDIRPRARPETVPCRAAPSVKLATLQAALERAQIGLAASGLEDKLNAQFDAASVGAAKALMDAYGAGAAPDIAMSRLVCEDLQNAGAADEIATLTKLYPLTGTGDLGSPSAFDGISFLEDDLSRRANLSAAVRQAQERLQTMVDRLGDVLLSDAVGAMADRRIESANAALGGLGVGARPPADADALGPATSGTALYFTMALMTDTGANMTRPPATDFAAQAVPQLADIAARVLGELPGRIRIERKSLTFEQMGISPLTLALLSSTGAPPEACLTAYIRAKEKISENQMIRFSDQANAAIWAAGALGQSLREAKTLTPEDMPDEAEAQIDDAAVIREIARLRTFYSDLLRALKAGTAQSKIVAAGLYSLGMLPVSSLDEDASEPARAALSSRLAAANAQQADRDVLKALIGDLPFVLPMMSGAAAAWEGAATLTGAHPDMLALWLEDCQRVRPRLEPLADVMLGHDEPPLAALQWHENGEIATLASPIDWIGAPLREDDVYRAEATIVAIGASPSIRRGSVFGGLIVDSWREVVPDRTLTPALTTELPAPEARAPQALLLAVPQSLGQVWTPESLFAITEKAIEAAKARVALPGDLRSSQALPDTLTHIGMALPLGAMRSNETSLTRAACPPQIEG